MCVECSACPAVTQEDVVLGGGLTHNWIGIIDTTSSSGWHWHWHSRMQQIVQQEVQVQLSVEIWRFHRQGASAECVFVPLCVCVSDAGVCCWSNRAPGSSCAQVGASKGVCEHGGGAAVAAGLSAPAEGLHTASSSVCVHICVVLGCQDNPPPPPLPPSTIFLTPLSPATALTLLLHQSHPLLPSPSLPIIHPS